MHSPWSRRSTSMSCPVSSDSNAPLGSPVEWERIFEQLESEIGLELRARDRRRIQQGVAERMRRLRLTRLHEYLPRLGTDTERAALIRVATIAESWFFRDTGQMRLIRHLLLPRLIAARQAQRRLRLWSAGCAGGQETWSLAMLVAEALPEASRWEVLILGTDINVEALTEARAGVYRGWSLRGLSETSRNRFFTPDGDGWRVGEDLRRWVRFAQDNLVGDGPTPLQDADLILCRNVLIYLRRQRLSLVMQRLGAALRPAGLLVTGHGELLDVANEHFEILRFPEGVVYRYRSNPRPAEVAPISATSAPSGALSQRQMAGAMPTHGSGPHAEAFPPAARTSASRPSTAANRHAATSAPARVTPLPTDSLAMAEVHAAQGDYARAAEFARQAQQADALDYRPLYLLAQIAEMQGDDGEARRRLAQVLYLAPDFVPACLDTAAYLERQGDTERATRHRRAARRLLDRQPDEQTMEPPYQAIRIGTLKAYLDELLGTADARQDMIGRDADSLTPPRRQ